MSESFPETPLDRADPGGPGRFGLAATAPTHVMIVEDNIANQIMLKTIVESMGVTRVSLASNGLDCLDLLDRGDLPDLVLLDVVMPGMDGFEVCRRIRARADGRDLTIVIQTALHARNDRLEAFAAGATDLVGKPIFPTELRARLAVHLENRLLLRSLKSFRVRLTEQLGMASRMQQSIMPSASVIQDEVEKFGLEFDAFYRSCDEIGGDLWKVVPLGDQCFAVVLFDLNGHGLVAAINAFRADGLASSLAEHARDPAAWLSAFNRKLYREFDSSVFATGLYGIIDLFAGRFRYASAGWMPPLLGHQTDGEPGFACLPSSGVMLGMLAEVDYPLREAAFGPGDALLLYSDGLCLGPERDEIAAEALAATLASTVAAGPDRVIERLVDALPCRTSGVDDVMALWFHRRADQTPTRSGGLT